MSKKLKVIFASMIVLAIAAGCAPKPKPQLESMPLIMPVSPYEVEFVVQRKMEDVYQTLVELSQHSNLNAVTLDPKAGLLRFEQQALTPVDLDSYCQFPVVDTSTEQALSNFQAWDQRLLDEGATSTMRGEVTISILLTAEHADRTRVSLRSNWAAVFSLQKQPCTSRGLFESRFEKQLRKRLGYIQEGKFGAE